MDHTVTNVRSLEQTFMHPHLQMHSAMITFAVTTRNSRIQTQQESRAAARKPRDAASVLFC